VSYHFFFFLSLIFVSFFSFCFFASSALRGYTGVYLALLVCVLFSSLVGRNVQSCILFYDSGLRLRVEVTCPMLLCKFEAELPSPSVHAVTRSG